MLDEHNLPALMTIRDFARLARLNERTVRRWIQRRWLRASKIGTTVRIWSDDALALLEATRVRPNHSYPSSERASE